MGSGYGGNALLGKKCHALRIASAQARQEGWLAEHMLILGVEDPTGKVTYLAAAMPSASGKTNLAMVISRLPGYRCWTVGDDIAWIHVDKQGQLRAVNPERGFFGVAPNTSRQDQSQRDGHGALQHHLHQCRDDRRSASPGGKAWTRRRRAGTLDWQGKAWQPGGGPAAHPNSRFTVLASQCPSIAPNWEDPEGVPISAFIFGSRRAQVVPLVFEAFDWDHGVFLGSAMGTETTAAITGAGGRGAARSHGHAPLLRLQHGRLPRSTGSPWGRRLKNPPKIFRVNWFRRDADGKFLWPGYSENVRVLKWILERIQGGGQATETAIGNVPAPGGARPVRARHAAGPSWPRRCAWARTTGCARSTSWANSTRPSATACRGRSGRRTRRRSSGSSPHARPP